MKAKLHVGWRYCQLILKQLYMYIELVGSTKMQIHCPIDHVTAMTVNTVIDIREDIF